MRFLSTALLLAFVILSTPANTLAGTVDVDWSAVKAISAHMNGVSGTSFGTTEFDLDFDMDMDGVFEVTGIPAYCAQIEKATHKGQYDVTGFVPVADLGQNYVNAAFLMKNAAPGLGASTLGYSTKVYTAGVQAAVWSLLYGMDFVLFSGGDVATVYNTLMSTYAMGDADPFMVQDMVVAIIPDVQDMLMQTPEGLTTPVPVPGALWLLGSGLAGLVGLRRIF